MLPQPVADVRQMSTMRAALTPDVQALHWVVTATNKCYTDSRPCCLSRHHSAPDHPTQPQTTPHHSATGHPTPLSPRPPHTTQLQTTPHHSALGHPTPLSPGPPHPTQPWATPPHSALGHPTQPQAIPPHSALGHPTPLSPSHCGPLTTRCRC